MNIDVSIEILKACPNMCLHCSSSSSPDSDIFIPFSKIQTVFDGLRQLNTKRICLSGGEPFLHPDLLKIVKYAQYLGIELNIYSSGISINHQKNNVSISAEEFSILKEAGLSKIMFNLQSVHELNYDQITNTKGHFELALNSIKNAISSDIVTEIHFVPMKINSHELNDIVSLGHILGVQQVSFLKLVPHGRAKENIDLIMLDTESDQNIQKQLQDLKSSGAKIRIGLPFTQSKSNALCHAATSKLYIKYDGTVYICEAFKFVEFSNSDGSIIKPENIFSNSIEHIVKNSEHLEACINLIKEFSHIESECENCPVQKYLKLRRS